MFQSVRCLSTQLPSIKNVAVIGGGQMGSGIAQVVAQSGQNVSLIEVNDAALNKARKTIEKNLKKTIKKMKMDKSGEEEFIDSVLKRITFGLDIEEAASTVDLVIEAVAEDLKLKRKIFSTIDKIAPKETIFGTNTSSIFVKDIACCTERQDRFAGLHFFNPVPVLKLVELVRTEKVSEEVYEHLRSWVGSIDRVPIACKDTPGFIVNRLIFPLIAEAIRMYERGDAELEDIDNAMKLGCAHPIGPIELSDLIGHDTIYYSGSLWKDLNPGNPLFETLKSQKKLVEEGKFGIKTGEGSDDGSLTSESC